MQQDKKLEQEIKKYFFIQENSNDFKNLKEIFQDENKIIKHFSYTSSQIYNIGYASKDYKDLRNMLSQNKELLIKLIRLNFIELKDNQLNYKFLKDNYIFPIIRNGSVVAFLAENENGDKTSTTPNEQFHPNKTFFATEENIENVIKEKKAYIINSCIDTVRCNQHGTNNILSPVEEFSNYHVGFIKQHKITPTFIFKEKDQNKYQNVIINCIRNSIYSNCIIIPNNKDISNFNLNEYEIKKIDSHIVLANTLVDNFEDSINDIPLTNLGINKQNAIYNLSTLFKDFYTPYLNDTAKIIVNRLSNEYYVPTKKIENEILNLSKNSTLNGDKYFEFNNNTINSRLNAQNRLLKSFLKLISSKDSITRKEAKNTLKMFHPIGYDAIIFKNQLLNTENLNELLISSYDLSIYSNYDNNFISQIHQLINSDISNVCQNIPSLVEAVNYFQDLSQEIIQLEDIKEDSDIPILHLNNTYEDIPKGKIDFRSLINSIINTKPNENEENINKLEKLAKEHSVANNYDPYYEQSQKRLLDRKI